MDQKVPKNTDYSEGHIFKIKCLDMALSQGHFTQPFFSVNQNLRFGMVVFKTSQNIAKNRKKSNSLFFRAEKCLVKKFVRSCLSRGASHIPFYQLNSKSLLFGRVICEKSFETFPRFITFCSKIHKNFGVSAYEGEFFTHCFFP